jgi:hypothetical protein
MSIYRFSAAEVAAALAQAGSTLQVSGHKWLDYSMAGLTAAARPR